MFIGVSCLVGPSAWALTDGEREQIRNLREWYPRQACNADRELGQCFKWAKGECEKKAAKALDACVKRLDRTMRGSASGDLSHWERQVFSCSFEDLKSRHAKIFLGGAVCDISGGAN